MRLINGKAYAACKICGWNDGNKAHTSGAHSLSEQSGYSVTFALKTKMNALDDDGGDDDDRGDDRDGGVSSFAAIMEKCSLVEKEDSDPENSAFAGRLAMLLKSIEKNQGGSSLLVFDPPGLL